MRSHLAGVALLLVLGLLLPLTAMALASAPAAQMGDELRGNGWVYRVVSFERIPDALPGDSGNLTVTERDILGVLVLDATNATQQPRALDLARIALRDASGRLATAIVSPAPAEYLEANDFAPANALVDPGHTLRLALFFSVDPSWSFPTLQLDPGLKMQVRIDECRCQLPLPWLQTN